MSKLKQRWWPGRRWVSAGLGLVLMAGLLSAARVGGAAAPAEGPAFRPVLLRLRTGSHDPLRTVAVAGRAPAVPAALRDLHLVQFQGPIRAEWQAALEATGAVILEYIPDFTYLVRAPHSAVARFQALPGYRWHGFASTLRQPQGARVSSLGSRAFPADSPLLAAGVARLASGRGGKVMLDVMTMPGANTRVVARQLPGRVVQLSARRRGFLRIEVPVEAVAQAAAVPGVMWVERYEPPTLFCDVAGGVMQAPAAREELGLYGRGQVIAIADTGLDVGRLESLSADFRGRVRRGYALNRTATGDWSDLHGHGTHVCGAAVGAGVLSGADAASHLYDGSFAGMAPEASLVIQSIGAATGALALPPDLGQMLLTPYQNDAARIHCDSWGTSAAEMANQYLMHSWQIDEVCWQAKDLLVLFAAGNGGVDANGDGVVDAGGLSPQATAKNALVIGASESFRDQPTTWGTFPVFASDPLQGDRLADNPGGMAAFSSRGPTLDGRIKPDLVAPGTWILSTRSHTPGSGALWGAYNGDYAFSGGTSMAAPLVAGAAALLREGLQERYDILNPSSALVKAALINGADDLAPGQYGTRSTREIPPRPNPIQGWGRVNVGRSLAAGGGRVMLPIDSTAGLRTEERRKYSVTVAPGDGPLRVTLAWTDPPSSLLGSVQLVNDLDLKLLTPDGKWLFGNGGTDRVNNVEEVEIARPAAGVYTLIVDGYNIPQGPQPFALVASGPLQAPAATGIQGSARAAGTSLPLTGADITVSGARTLHLTCAADGRFEARLPAGSYTLTPSRLGWGFDPPSWSVTVKDGQMLAVHFTATAAAGSLTGKVTRRDGTPAAGVRISLSPGDQTTTTGADGTYRFGSLPPLVYAVTPSLAESGFTPPGRKVRVPAGGAARVDFTATSAAVQGTVVAAGLVERQVIASAHPVRAAGTQNWTVSRPGARWIRVHFTRIDVQPGAERVEVFDANNRLVSRWSGGFSDVWSAWVAGSSLTVRHTAGGVFARFGFELDGVQTDLGGRPLVDTAVSLQPGARSTRTGSLGSYRFSGLSGTSFSLAPSQTGWEFSPALATLTLPPGVAEGTVNFIAQGPPSLTGQVTAAGSTQPVRYESLHPYPHGATRLQEISVPGATRLRLHFARLATEFGTDYVRLIGPDGAELKRYSGTRTDFWTDWLPASRITLRFESDESLSDWGYLIDRIAWDGGAEGAAAGVSVSLTPGGATAVTGPDGRFTLSDLAPGQYTVRASGPGLQVTPGERAVRIEPWGTQASFEATRLVPPQVPGVLAALVPGGRAEVRSFAAGAWSAAPAPAGGPFDRLLALQGVNDTPELIAQARGHLGHCRLLEGEWSAWVPVPGSAASGAPVAAVEPDGTVNVLAVGPEGTVLHFRYVNGIWQEPAVAAGVPAWDGDRAALAAREDGTLELVGVGGDGVPRHSRFIDGAWTTRGAVGSATTALRPALAVGTGAPGAEAPLELVLVAEDGRVLHQRFLGGAWSGPRSLRAMGGQFMAGLTAEAGLAGDPALIAGPDARLELVVPTTGGLYHARMRGASWSDAQKIEGIATGSLVLVSLPRAEPPATAELFVTSPDGVVTHLRYRDGRWTPPAELNGLVAMGLPAPASR